MNLAEELAAAAFAASSKRLELLQRERARLAEMRERLTAELALDELDEGEAALASRRDALVRGLAVSRREAEELLEVAGDDRRALQEGLGAAVSEMRQRCRAQGVERLVETSLHSAREAFGLHDEEASPAELQAELDRCQRRARTRRQRAAARAQEISQTLRDEAARLAPWRRLEEEERQLASRESELLGRLRSHDLREHRVPPIVESLRQADARTLKQFRERVLETLLGDLSTQAERWLAAQDGDPLNDLVAKLRR